MTQTSVFRLNRTGFAEGLPVRAAVTAPGEVGLTDAAGRVLRTWQVAGAPVDEASGDRVTLLDAGPLPAGTYYLTHGEERRPLTVAARPWQAVTDALIKGLYYQRCGCALEERHAGRWTHGPCHTAMAVDWEDRSVKRHVTGGWHDAGDYGKYTAPGAVAAAHLIYAWLLFPQGCSGDLNIPETGSGVPDILSEARWELEWLLKMQRDDGAFRHKLTKARFAPFIMPEEDRETEYLMPAAHCATGAACACLALAARVWRPLSEGFANRMLLSALRAWDWLEKHPDFVPFKNPEGVRTGQYGDRSDRDERFWAACELFAAAGEERFRTAAEALFAEGQALARFGWSDVAGLGALCCLFELGERGGPVLYGRLRESFLEQSEKALDLTRQSGYGTALPADRYIWGSILPILNNAMAMIVNHLLTGRTDMRDAALLQWDYALGLNALDICFVTGFGERRVMHPHHRPSGADGIDEPVPGLISGGPNKCFPYPQTREKLGEDVPPARYFLDETPSADTNEIAVYWNSPAVFTGAWANTLTSEKERKQ